MTTTSHSRPHGFHMVGSVPKCFTSSEEVFRYVCATLPPNCIARIPDGETGARSEFVYWQFALFPPEAFPSFGTKPPAAPTLAELDAMIANLKPIDTGYDEAAITSYETFRKLKQEGVVPTATKFQVSIPSVVGTVVCLEGAYRAALEPAYEDAIDRALAKIQTNIPAQDLAIQIDVATDIGVIEGVVWTTPYWEGDRFDGVVDRLLRLVARINIDVDLGFHFCYGDMKHKHYMEPNDTGTMTRLAKAIIENGSHVIKWIHMPVPKDRDDTKYFKPLADLDLGDTKLFLGLVHPCDEEGTIRRIEAAKKAGVLTDFGVATECGMGRTPEKDLDEIFRVAKAVAAPYEGSGEAIKA